MNTLTEKLQRLPDTRPYPETPTKNDALRQAADIVANTSAAQVKLAQEQLDTGIHAMLAQNHYLSLSVALSMIESPAQYRVLWQALCKALSPHAAQEVQWLAFPVVVVIGAERSGSLKQDLPQAALNQTLKQYGVIDPDTLTWLPQLLDAEDISRISAGDWYAAKQDLTAAQNFAGSLSGAALSYESGQEVRLVYALAYGTNAALREAAGKNLGEAALPLMQVWQEHLTADGLTVFANPLNADLPAAAQMHADTMRRRMACDVFTANAIRSLRLQHPRVGVIIAARDGGELLFSFQTTEPCNVPPLNFHWHLAPSEEIPLVLQNFIDLLAECRMEQVRIVQDILFAQEPIPLYQEAVAMRGFNPFFPENTEA
ncbi:MAG: conjugal transfer protein [Neisseria sp.]|nr:conjugal transfer protein [Neisseria sp.]